MYEERTYRNWVKDAGLFGFQALVQETDLYIRAKRDLSREAIDSIVESRAKIEEYIKKDPEFQTTLKPHIVTNGASSLIKSMAQASALVGVGPFASVAGAIAEYVGKNLAEYSEEVIIENGGDIFIKSSQDRTIGIYAGSSSLNGKLAIKIKAKDTPLGICTSSGTVGHSLSLGKADAVVAISKSTALADAAATRIGNIIKEKSDIETGLKFAKKIKGIRGVLIIKDDKFGVWGDIELCQV